VTSSSAAEFDAATIRLDGKNLVEASAGTGKTYAITTLFVRLVVEKGLAPADILVVTFTDAATAELRDRVRRRLGEAERAFAAALRGEPVADEALGKIVTARGEKLGEDLARVRLALENIDDAPISTIHGFCQRVLHDHALATRVPFGAELVPDLGELVDDVLFDFWQRNVAFGPESLARQAAMLGVDLPRLRRLFEEVRRHPRVTVVPAPAAAVTTDALTAAFDAAREAYERFDLLEFMEVRGNATSFGKPPERQRLADQVADCLRAENRSAPWVPKHAERLFVANVSGLKGDASNPFFAAFDGLTRLAWRSVVGLQHALLSQAPADLLARKLELGVLGFEDLLLLVAEAVRGDQGDGLCASLRRRYRAVLIDEFQDTDPVQFEIFHGVFGDGTHPLFLIGDPKQAIYGFRGADVFAYLDAAGSARAYSMGVSFRSDPALVSAVNALFCPDGTFLIPGIGYAGVTAKPGASNGFCAAELPAPSHRAALDLVLLEREPERDDAVVNKPLARSAAARVVAADIVRLLGGAATLTTGGPPRPVTPGDVAVLTRTNAQCFLVQDVLRERGVHSVVITDSSVFESGEAAEVEAVLRAVLDPSSRLDVRRALATSLLGVTGDELAARETDTGWWQAHALELRGWHELWQKGGFIRMFRALLDGAAVARKLLERPGGERRLTNVLHLAELLHRATVELALGPGALLSWLVDQRAGREKGVERAEIRLESDESLVKILTVHKAKGLEFPIVYCPFLWDAVGGGSDGPVRFHDGESRALLDVDVDAGARADNVARATWESFAEEIRVVYVALTRAKHRTVVVWGGFRGTGATAAASLFHPAASLDPTAVPAAGRLDALRDDELEAALGEVAARAPGHIAVRRVAWDFDRRHVAEAAPTGPAFAARALGPRVTSWARTGSFSNLVKHDAGVPVDPDWRDRDEPLAGEPVDPGELPVVVPPDGGPPITLLGFEKGRRTGDLIHDLLEALDFATATDETIARVATGLLEAYGFAASLGADLQLRQNQLVRAVREALETPLSPGGPRLRDLGARHKLVELEFRMPAGHLDEAFTVSRLARVFREHPSTEPQGAVPKDYHRRVERLGFRALTGFLKGFIDLVFEHEGRWYVVDYKTSHLGDERTAYHAEAMRDSLAESHYYLQYHVYALALHRHLGRVVPGYDYERHFGGVYYLYLKGMHPEDAAPHGVFFERPPLSRMNALSDALDGRSLCAGKEGVSP
jgi:exodeoxyribonuclease V beta subunit